jgi:hypothetical protein
MTRLHSLAALLALSACAEPPLGDAFNQLEVFVDDAADDTSGRFLSLIRGAKKTLDVALPGTGDPALTEAILDADRRGVDVSVVTDADLQADPGLAALVAEGVPVAFADGPITYFDFNLNAPVTWGSEQAIMSHGYAIADHKEALIAPELGMPDTGPRWALAIQGEELLEDLEAEHNQLLGGSDAVATTAFDGMAKSIADNRWNYPLAKDLTVELWFGPQERLTKRIIDAVYSARASVRVLTDDFSNDGLARALHDKVSDGFDVTVVVGPHFGLSSSILSRILTDETPGLTKLQVTDPSLTAVPTLVLIDYGKDRNGIDRPARAMMLSHDLFSAARSHRGAEVANDQLVDGSLWVLRNTNSPSAELLALEELWTTYLDGAVNL